MPLESITSAVRSIIAGRNNSAFGGSNSGVDFHRGTTKEGANSALGSIDITGKYNTAMYSYPENVGNDARQGHYIVFTINKFSPGKIKHSSTISMKDIKQNLDAEFPSIELDFDGETDDAISGSSAALSETVSGRTKGGGGSIAAEKPKKSISAAISLYMPPSVTAQYKVGYVDSQIGALAMIGKDAYNSVAGGDGFETALTKIVDSAASTGAEGLKMKGLGLVDVAAPGTKALVQLETGKVVTPKMELMFENVGRRDFSFTFNFIPKSAKEAKTIERIIHTFKLNMMPEFVVGSEREMKIPNTFDIQYMNQGVENKFINKISTCFLKGVDVTYGGDRFTAYDPIDGSPPPQRSSISLSFTEIETLSKDLIKEGF